MEDQDNSNKRENPYLSNSLPLNKRQHVTLKPHTKSEDATSDLLGRKTGIHLAPPQKPTTTRQREKYIYGNYTNYYKTRRNDANKLDPRLSLLNTSLFKDKNVLDIGCNSGNITIVIGQQCKPRHILGVDIDDRLIAQARTLLRTTYSLQQPNINIDNDDSKPLSVDVKLQTHYFPRSMVTMFGFMSTNMPPSYKNHDFPYNTSFQEGDWLNMDIKENEYDTILALSITKWIQLHRGDQGIKDFFQRVYQSLKPGGVLVLEPQTFKSYERRAKGSEEMTDILDKIKFKPEDYDDYLMKEVGFKVVTPLGTPNTDSKGFSRPLYLYTK
ncbi:Bicoid-interacting protein 3-domain-containing protein [Halteromyces radiatus]|uniref:Bicoid-interacting protein 3-domain-containing protein n=1 Tax=Halteromyces radiatus TaxID=101107 RepID=UPI00221EEF1B|nr:Bicoid-interacting protein 3-domain-containing protein [Halteromyces radiatus]KAI8098921.1 Bicoid-interacting protein 3-domain-containing protein [Halteromyces radiatus]